MSEKPARRWAGELFVLIVGILGAFALDSWWEQRSERRQMVLELEAVAEAFAGDVRQLDFMIDTHRRVVAGLGRVLALQEDGVEAGLDRVSVPDSLLFTAIVTPTFDPSLGALRVLLESGRFALIEDRDLRQSLAGWQERLNDANEYVARDVRFGTDEVWPRLLFDATHEDVVDLLEVDGAYWDGFWMGTEGSAPLPSGSYELPTDDAYRSVLFIKRAMADGWLRELEPLSREMERLTTLIAAEISR